MEELRAGLKEAIKDLYNLDFDPEITLAPDTVDADFSSNVPLKLAKNLHKNPMEIAEELSEHFVSICDNGSKLASEPHNDGRERSGSQNVLTTPPGFINFKLSPAFLRQKLNALRGGFKVSSKKYANKTIVCEFSDPNPFKVLHVGHLYTSVVGDAISRLFECAGAHVIRANFGGDVGLHVAKTMYILKQHAKDTLTIEDIARCYVEGTAAYEDDPEARASITALNKEIYKINAENIHGTELSDLYWRGRELSYAYFEDFYAKIGVKFDKYYPESTVAALGLQKVQEGLKNGVYEKSAGAVIFDGEKYGLHTRVFVNQEGVPTYEAKDVGLIFTKWQDYHFDKSVVITGSEQLEYMKVVLKSVEQYAPDLVEKTAHLTHGLVKLPGNVKMSSRKGNFLKAVDVLDLVAAELKKAYGSLDPKIVMAALKYAFLKYKMGGDIIFSPEESVKMTGNSGPYLLYSAVRAKKILKNAQNHAEIPNYIYNIYEQNLIKKLLMYEAVLTEAVDEMAPHKVATYLYEVSQEFSRFYENCQVAGAPEEAERIKLVEAYFSVMQHGLNLLGIAIPEEM